MSDTPAHPQQSGRVSGHLELRSNSKYFYARVVSADRKKSTVPLRVPVLGARPASMAQLGDKTFELSRARAAEKLESLLGHMREGRQPHDWGKPAVALAKKNEALAITQLVPAWRSLYPNYKSRKERKSMERPAVEQVAVGRTKVRVARNNSYLDQVCSLLTALAAWCACPEKQLAQATDISTDIAAEFINYMFQKGGTKKTSNNRIIMLRGAFTSLQRGGFVTANPFAQLQPEEDLEIVSRTALSGEQTKSILQAAEADPEYHDVALIVRASLSSSLRKINCATLTWASVRFAEGVLALKPAKGGKPVRIPILPPLRKILDAAASAAGPNPSGYVFPDLAAAYHKNPEQITIKFRKLLKQLGYTDEQIWLNKPGRLRRASKIDIAALRTSFVTLGLDAGIPDIKMIKLTGHATVNHVRTTYYQPTDKSLAEEMAKLPSVLTGTEVPAPPPQSDGNATDPVAAFLSALDFCAPDNVAVMLATLRSLALALPLTLPQQARLKCGINILTPENIEVLRPSVARAARGIA